MSCSQLARSERACTKALEPHITPIESLYSTYIIPLDQSPLPTSSCVELKSIIFQDASAMGPNATQPGPQGWVGILRDLAGNIFDDYAAKTCTYMCTYVYTHNTYIYIYLHVQKTYVLMYT